MWEHCNCIRTVRKVMKALLNKQRLDDEGLVTLVCEAEAIANGRPVTKVSGDPRDPKALTPNHLLLLCSGPTLPPGVFPKGDCYSRRRWRHVQYLADGCGSISHRYNKGKNGVMLTGILQLVMSSCCWMKPCQEAPGLLDVS